MPSNILTQNIEEETNYKCSFSALTKAVHDSVFSSGKITVDVIIAEESGEEVGVRSEVDQLRLIITGRGNSFRTYPIPAK